MTRVLRVSDEPRLRVLTPSLEAISSLMFTRVRVADVIQASCLTNAFGPRTGLLTL
jgi:hypothetical protein